MNRSPADSRRGGVSVIALACLAVVAALALAVIRGAVVVRGALRGERSARQVECLLDATAAWTAAQLEAGRDPTSLHGMPAAEIVGTADAAVDITTAAAAPGSWRVRIVVTYPSHGPHLVRRTREMTVVTSRPPQESLP